MKKISTELIKYVATGLSAAVLEFASFAALLFILQGFQNTAMINALSHSGSVVLGASFTYIVNKIWTFDGGKEAKLATSLPKYILLFCVNLALSNTVLYLLSPQIGAQLAKFFVMVMIVPWNFLMYKFFVYK